MPGDMLKSDTVKIHKEALDANFFKAMHANFEMNWLSGFREQWIWLFQKEHKKHELIAPDGISQWGERDRQGVEKNNLWSIFSD